MDLFKTIIAEVIKGKTVVGTLFNYDLKSYEVGGKILDLGSGRKLPSYHRFLRFKKDSIVLTVDISTVRNPDIIADLETPFPFREESFDTVIAFNLLEHIYDYKNVLRETHQVLKNGGKFYIAVPFLVDIHPDPYDYFRYTEAALLKLLTEAGFSGVYIKALGYGPFSAACFILQSFMPRALLWLFPICLVLDKLASRFSGVQKDIYPYMYLVTCQK